MKIGSRNREFQETEGLKKRDSTIEFLAISMIVSKCPKSNFQHHKEISMQRNHVD